MQINRTTILRSPGTIAWDGATIHSEADIEVTISKELFEVLTSAHGVVDQRVADKTIEITATPSMWDSMAKLLPYATLPIGGSIYGATDTPLVITPRDGAPLTIANAAVTGLPPITLSARQSHVGAMTWTGIVANSSQANALASYLTLGSVASAVAMTGFDLSKVRNAAYTGTRNSVSLIPEEGFVITPDLSLDPIVVDGIGTVDMRLTGLSMTAAFTPVGLTEAELMTMIGFAEGIGQAPAKHDLSIVGGGLTFVVKNTLLRQAAYRYGAANRIGALEALTVRTNTAGVTDALWTITEA